MTIFVELDFLLKIYDNKFDDIDNNIVSTILHLLRQEDINFHINMEVDNNTFNQTSTSILKEVLEFLEIARIPTYANFEQAVISKESLSDKVFFVNNRPTWKQTALYKGALIFDYIQVKDILTTGIYQFKIDLSEPFLGWSNFSNLSSLISNEISLIDKYCLCDRNNQRIKDNVSGFFKSIIPITHRGKVYIYSETFNQHPDELKPPVELTPNTQSEWLENKKEELANKSLLKVKSGLRDYNDLDLKIIRLYTNNNLRDHKIYGGFTFHDRVFLSDYFTVDFTKGINIKPWKESNSQIIVDCFFDPYTFKRIKKMKRLLKKYRKELDDYPAPIWKIIS